MKLAVLLKNLILKRYNIKSYQSKRSKEDSDCILFIKRMETIIQKYILKNVNTLFKRKTQNIY